MNSTYSWSNSPETHSFQFRLIKKETTGGSGASDGQNNEGSGSASAPTIPTASQGTPPAAPNDPPAQVAPTSFHGAVQLGANAWSAGFNVGSLSLDGAINPSLASLANLRFLNPGFEGVAVTSVPELRQIHLYRPNIDGADAVTVNAQRAAGAGGRLIDILPYDANGGIVIRFYEEGNFGAIDEQSGLHPVGAVTSRTVTYLPIAAAGGHLGGIRAITAGANGIPFVTDYVTLSTNSWRTTRSLNGVELEVEDRTSIFAYEGGMWKRIDSVEVKREGVLYSKSLRTYGYLYRTPGPETELFLLEESIYDTANSSLTTTWEPDPVNFGKVKSVTHPDGSWEAFQYYTGTETIANGDPYTAAPSWAGALKETLKPWNGQPASAAAATAANSERTVVGYGTSATQGLQPIERITTRPGAGGVKTTAKWARSTGDGSMVGLLPDAGLDSAWMPTTYDQVGSLTFASNGEWISSTSTSYSGVYQEQNPWAGEQLSSLDAEGNGTVTGHERGTYVSGSPYTFTANDPYGPEEDWGTFIRTISVKVANFGSPVNSEASREVTISNASGQPCIKELSFKDGAGNWSVATTTTYEYPTYWPDGSASETIVKQDGRVIRHEKSEISGTVILTTTWDEQGIETRTLKDGLGRTSTITRIGVSAQGGYEAQPDVVTTYSYNGRTTTTTVSAGGLSRTQVSVEDLMGRSLSETDASGAITLTSYPNGGRDTSVTLPGGLTRLSTRSIDGLNISTTGTAVIPEYVEYSVLASGNLAVTRRLGSTNSPRYSTSESDWAGRSVLTTSPSPTGTGVVTQTSTYATNTERLVSRTSPAGTIRYGQPVAGSSMTYSGLDGDGNGILEPASSDRLTETQSYHSFENGGWWEVSVQKTYDVTGSSASAITSVSKNRVNASLGGLASLSIQISPGGLSVSHYTAIDLAGKTLTTIESSPASSMDAITVNVNGLTVSSSGHDTSRATRWSYNALGQPVRETSPRGEITLKSYNADGSLATTTDHANQVTGYAYYGPTHVSAGKVSVVTNPQGKTTTYTYSALGQLTEQAGTATYRITYDYDAYGARNKMWTWRDATNSSLTQWIYQDGTGLLLTKLDAASQPTGYTYEASGKIHSRTWARGVSTTYSYNAFSDLTGIDYSDSTPDVTLTGIDRLGRPTGITQTGIGSETLSYHPGLGAPNAEFYTSGHTVLPGVGLRHSAPDSASRPSGFQETTGSDASVLRTVGYGYDGLGRFQTLSDGAETTTYTYWPDSSLISTIESQTGGTSWFKESRYFDTQSRLTGIRSDRMNGGSLVAPISSYAYDYDSLNRRIKSTFQDGSRWEYGYNDHSEVTSATRKTSGTSPTTLPQLGATYSYDGIGNRLSSTSPVLGDHSYTPNSLNQYASLTTGNTRTAIGRAPAAWNVEVAGVAASRTGELYHRALTASNGSAPVWQGVVTRRDSGTPTMTNNFWYAQATFSPTYDADGNLTNDGRWVYTWNAENRLIQMETTTTATTAGHPYTKLVFDYDWQGRRIERIIWRGGTAGSPTFHSRRRWLYDGWNPIAEFDSNASGTTNTRVASFTWGLDLFGTLQGAGGVGGLISKTDTTGPVTHRASYDGNGNIVAWTQSTQSAPEHRREYDAFGNKLVSEGTSPSDYGFSTKQQDPFTGLYYYGYRFYDTEHGRWLNRDPIDEAGGVNLYSFTNNRGVSSIDYLGMWGESEHSALTDDSFRLATLSESDESTKEVALQWLQKANRLQDFSGSANVDLKRHFNRHIDMPNGSGAQQAIIDYTEYLDFETGKYVAKLANSPMAISDCRGSILELGRLTHSWQDYYAHALISKENYFSKVLWTAFPQITGSPDSPRGSSGIISPSSYDDEKNKGEHGPFEISGLEGELRMSDAREFVAGKYKHLLLGWIQKCSCHAKNMGAPPNNFDVK